MLRFRGIIIVVVCLILSILAISINPIKISDWERGNNDNFLGMVLGLDLRGGTHLVYSIISSSGEEPTIEENQVIEEPEVSNGLENFEIEEETPELFNSESEDSLTNETLDPKETDNLEEDDLEIPAFLRRQKN